MESKCVVQAKAVYFLFYFLFTSLTLAISFWQSLLLVGDFDTHTPTCADNRRNSEMFRVILSAHNLPNASELILTVLRGAEAYAKATKEFFKAKKWNVVQWP